MTGTPADDDWRLAMPHEHLRGLTLVRRQWTPPPGSHLRAWRLADGSVMETPNPDAQPPRGAVEEVEPRGWDHDHCEFCWAALKSAAAVAERGEAREKQTDIFTEGYTIAESESTKARIWICPTCFEDFHERFGLSLAE